jgi:hypothetical protein
MVITSDLDDFNVDPETQQVGRASRALRSRPAIQRIDLGPGDCLFDAGEVIVKPSETCFGIMILPSQ